MFEDSVEIDEQESPQKKAERFVDDALFRLRSGEELSDDEWNQFAEDSDQISLTGSNAHLAVKAFQLIQARQKDTRHHLNGTAGRQRKIQFVIGGHHDAQNDEIDMRGGNPEEAPVLVGTT